MEKVLVGGVLEYSFTRRLEFSCSCTWNWGLRNVSPYLGGWEWITMEWSYWKVILKYGHVGQRKEVSVARYLTMSKEFTLLDVMAKAQLMPGVKARGILSARRITVDEYLIGNREEAENFYLQKLKTFNQITS